MLHEKWLTKQKTEPRTQRIPIL